MKTKDEVFLPLFLRMLENLFKPAAKSKQCLLAATFLFYWDFMSRPASFGPLVMKKRGTFMQSLCVWLFCVQALARISIFIKISVFIWWCACKWIIGKAWRKSRFHLLTFVPETFRGLWKRESVDELLPSTIIPKSDFFFFFLHRATKHHKHVWLRFVELRFSSAAA